MSSLFYIPAQTDSLFSCYMAACCSLMKQGAVGTRRALQAQQGNKGTKRDQQSYWLVIVAGKYVFSFKFTFLLYSVIEMEMPHLG